MGAVAKKFVIPTGWWLLQASFNYICQKITPMPINQNLVSVTTILLACLGAIGGTILSNNFEKQNWNNESAYQESKALVDKRIEMIERTISIYNKCYEAILLEEDFARMTLTLDSNMYASKDDVTINNQIIENRLKINDLRMEFSVTMSLNSIFFGDTTKYYITNIMNLNPWWEINEDLMNDLINSMYSELSIDEIVCSNN